MRDMGRIGFERGWLDSPVRAQPIQKPVQLWWHRERVKIPVAAFEDGSRAPESSPGQQGALQAQLAGPPQMQPFGIRPAPGKLQQAGTAGASQAHRTDE